MSDLGVSYVIPFKDWGRTRLELAVETAMASLEGTTGEVIVSDFGSTSFSPTELADLRAALEQRGARYVRTETDGVWSRSRALNAGFAVARGRALVASDADMLVPPGCLPAVARIATDQPMTAVFLTCRDLPQEWDDTAVRERGIDWDVLFAAATRRPRWGMGLSAVSREVFDRVRGWDERFLIYGGEDNDFSARIQRAGARVVWPQAPEFSLLHMWHPSTSAAHSLSAADAAQIERNKAIARLDPTYLRNTTEWRHPRPGVGPVVSVVISTFNRRRMLEDAVNSVLVQTMQDFEIIVVDDGSTDDTAGYVESITDPRVRYVRQVNAGISAARNRGTDEARGAYVAVLDDDDLMLPWRLAAQLAALADGPAVVFGTFVNFNDATGDLQPTAVRVMDLTSAGWKGGAPGHSTWLVPTDVLRRVRYDESLSSGVDNDLALRLLRSGVTWVPCGRSVVLRRMHPTQVTVSDSSNQLGSASAALNRLQFGATTARIAETAEVSKTKPYVPSLEAGSEERELAPYLPDHLVRRWRLRLLPKGADRVGRSVGSVERAMGLDEDVVLEPVTWSQMAEAGAEAAGWTLTAVRTGAGGGPLAAMDADQLESLKGSVLRSLVEATVKGEKPQAAFVHEAGSSLAAGDRVAVAGGAVVEVEPGSFADPSRPPAWLPTWLASPGAHAVVPANDVGLLRRMWFEALTGGTGQM